MVGLFYTARIIISAKTYWLGLAAILAAGIALAFGQSVFFDFAPIDDYALIVQNLAIRQPSLDSIRWFFTHYDPELYIPLTYVCFFIDHLMWGLSPGMFHLHGLIIHGLNALLVAVLIQKLSGSRWIGAAGALLFAVHPLQTEAVVWIAARKDLLATFWSLVTILLVLRSEGRMEWRWIWLAACTFVLALLSKVSVAPLPLVLIVLLRMQFVSWTCIARRTAPLFVASAVFAAIAALGKADIVASLDPLHRLFLASYGMASVLGRMIVPVHLSAFYVPPAMSAGSLAIALLPPALLILAWVIRRRAPLAALGIVWIFALLLLPSFNAQIDPNAAGATFAADRYGYMPLVGALLVLSSLLRILPLRVAGAIAALILVGYVFLARAQTAVWASAPALYQHALEVEPASVDARVAIARMLRKEGRIEDAFAVLLTGLRYGDTKALHLEAGSIYAATGRIADAREQFTIARDRDPSAPEPYFALGELARQTGDTFSALGFYDEAISREPEYADAVARKAEVLAQTGETAAAEQLLRDILAFDPSNRMALLLLVPLLEAHSEDASLYRERILLLYPETVPAP